MPNIKKPIPFENERNNKSKLKVSDDGKFGLVGADTKFDLIKRFFGSTPVIVYNLTTNYIALNEPANIDFVFTTTGPDTTFYWTNSGTTNASDFVQNAISGSFITVGGSGSVTLSLVADRYTEGSETIQYHVRTGSTSGSIVASSPILVINDTSIGEYFISSSANTVNEGTQLSFTITTTAPDGELYWTGAGTTNSSDFIQNISSGSLFTTAGTGSLVLNVKNDILTEGIETFILQVRTNNYDGNVVAATSITINDTSTTQYSVSASSTNVIEGSPIIFTFTTTGADGTFNWYLDPVTFPIIGGEAVHPYPVASDFVEGITSGSFITVGGTGSVTLNVSKDLYTEPVERFRFKVSDVADLASSEIVYISDYYKIVPSSENINEGSAVTFTFTTEGSDETFYWSNDGSTNSYDFIEGLNSGSFATVSGTGSIVFTLKNDILSENTENIRILVRSGSSNGTLIAVSSYVYVEDTSTNQYIITASSNPVSEGSPITFTFTTSGVDETFNWENIGTSNAADFVENINSGSFVTVNGTGSLTLNIKEDSLTEGTETIRIRVRNALNQSLIDSSAVSIIDTSVSQYVINTSAVNINEGSSVTFTVTTTDTDGTYYWTNGGTTIASDFTSNQNSGSFIVANGSGSVTLTTKEDLLTEGSETIIFQLRSGSFDGDIVVTSSNVTVNDTSTNSYNVAVSSLYVGEGYPITFTFTTTGPDDTFDWYIDPVTFLIPGGGVGTHPYPIASDFIENVNSGSFATVAGTGSVTLTVANDTITEPPERFRFAVAGAASSPIVFITNRYGLYASVSNVNEGGSVTFTFVTEDPDGTFYWTNNGTSTASDFVENVMSGSFVTTSGTGSIVLTTVEDLTTEGTETIDIKIRSGSYSGNILAYATVDINDTSAYQYEMTPSSLLIGEEDTIIFTLTTNAPDQTFYWANVGTTNADDFIEEISSGSFVTLNGTGSLQLSLLEDNLAEPQETISIKVSDTEGGEALVYSPVVTVNNTSGDEVVITGSGPTPITFKLEPSTLSVYEGSPVTFTLTTNAPDQTFYWQLNSPSGIGTAAANSNDFIEGLSSGSFATVAGTGSFTLTTKDDLNVEYSIKTGFIEKFRILVTSGSFVGTRVGRTSNISIIDNYSYQINLISGSYNIATNNASENASFSVSIFSNITDGTYYWENTGTTTGSDFVNGHNSGSFTMTNGTGSISLALKQDLLTEGSETIVLQIMSGALRETKAILPAIIVNDTSLTQYTISPSSTSINEGGSVTFTFTTSGPDETFYWSNIGTTVASDFVGNTTTGSFATVAGTGSVALSIRNDLLTEGTETIVLQVRSGSIGGSVVATSDIVNINDTSVTQYALFSNNASVIEGDSITFDFTTTGPDETFYWTNGGTTTASDFANNSNSGSFVTTSGTGSITLTLQEDMLAENETIILQARSGSLSGPIVATSFSINVISASYALSASSLTVDEGSSVTFTFTTSRADRTFYWTNSGTTTGTDFTNGANQGSFATTSGTGSVTLNLSNDFATEGAETIILQVRSESYIGSILATSDIVTVNDTSDEFDIQYITITDPNNITTTYSGSDLVSGISLTSTGSYTMSVINAFTGSVKMWGGAGGGYIAGGAGGYTSGSVGFVSGTNYVIWVAGGGQIGFTNVSGALGGFGGGGLVGRANNSNVIYTPSSAGGASALFRTSAIQANAILVAGGGGGCGTNRGEVTGGGNGGGISGRAGGSATVDGGSSTGGGGGTQSAGGAAGANHPSYNTGRTSGAALQGGNGASTLTTVYSGGGGGGGYFGGGAGGADNYAGSGGGGGSGYISPTLALTGATVSGAAVSTVPMTTDPDYIAGVARPSLVEGAGVKSGNGLVNIRFASNSVSAGWTPDLLNLKYGYYKADGGIRINTAGQMVSWGDQSGLGNTLTTTSYPTYLVTGALNGKPAVKFANSWLQNTNLQGINLTSSDMTIIYIGKMDVWEANRGMARFDIASDGSNSRSLALRTGPSNNWGGDANSNDGSSISGTKSYVAGLATTPGVRIVKRVNSEGIYVYENGTLVSQASASLAAYSNVTKRFMLGTNVNAGTRAQTTAYEVILLGYAISDEDIAKIQTYAQSYWGI